MCVGIDFCSKKNCLENERCLFPQQKAPKKVKINKCQFSKKFCSNKRACEILGQCMLEHPAVLANKTFKRELQKTKDLKAIAAIFVRYLVKVKKPNNKK